ncbi:MAG TPA: UvrD-helicase domain-containing protein [Solirubrobacteraceae bacterium]
MSGPAPSPAAVQLTLEAELAAAVAVAAPCARALTEEQEQAVARRAGSLLLAAGAGSGKTSVLVERFVRAVREDGVAPGRILAITFTERAAGELRERVRARFLELGERQAARDTEAAFVSTFHGFCARLLRLHALAAGLDPDFAILDEAQAGSLRARAFRAALGDLQEREGEPAVDLLAAYGADRVRAMVLGVYAQLRSGGREQPRLPAVLGGARAQGGGVEVDGQADVDGRAQADARADVDTRAARACALLDVLLGAFGARYAELKLRRGGVDFDDLELRAQRLLGEREDVRASLSQRLELLMVDEFQDTNRRQLEILTALQRENLFTVGDEFQSIYGFRHADPSLFRARRAELAARGASLALATNFRSRPPLLRAINAIFAPRFGAGFPELRAGRGEGRDDAEDDAGSQGAGTAGSEGDAEGEAGNGGAGAAPIELLLTDRRGWETEGLARKIAGELPDAPRWRQAEARLLAQRIAELVDEGRAQAADVVVLLRAVGDLPVYQRALEERGLRTLAAVGSFWGHQQVGDLLAYLHALANPLDELALYSTLASPLVGISSDGLALIARCAGRDGVWEACRRAAQGGGRAAGGVGEGVGSVGEAVGSVGEAVGGVGEERGAGQEEAGAAVPAEGLYERLAASDGERLRRFTERFLAERRSAGRHGIAELLLRAIAASGYERHVLGLHWGERRLANIHKLLRLARRFEAQEGRDLRGFLDHVSHQREALEGSEPQAPVNDTEPDAVRLMSIHAAKGLEFGVVCVADLGRTPNGGTPSLLVDGSRIGLRLATLDGAPATPTLDYEELLRERREAEAAEEERILYVAMTRARERLLLSGAADFERWPAARSGGAPIAWLGPALLDELPERVRSLSRPAGETSVTRPGEVSMAPSGDGCVAAPGQAPVRCWLNAPATFGVVLREASLAAAHTDAPTGGRAVLGEGLPAGGRPIVTGEQSSVTGQRSILTGGRPIVAGERPTVDGSRPPAGVEIPLSYTALSEIERCGYRYYLERVLGLPEQRGAARGEQRHGLQGRVRGTIVHRLLESLDFKHPHLPSAQDVARVARELGAPLDAAARADIVRLLGDACASELAARLAAAGRVRHEHPFAFSLAPGEPLVTGVLDVVVQNADGSVLIVDYKTDRVDPHEDLQALAAEHYGAQRLVYALAALHDGAREVEVIHWFLERPGELVAGSHRAAERDSLQRQLHARAERARERGFAVSPLPHRALCLTCPGRAGLCSWGERETLRERPYVP